MFLFLILCAPFLMGLAVRSAHLGLRKRTEFLAVCAIALISPCLGYVATFRSDSLSAAATMMILPVLFMWGLVTAAVAVAAFRES